MVPRKNDFCRSSASAILLTAVLPAVSIPGISLASFLFHRKKNELTVSAAFFAAGTAALLFLYGQYQSGPGISAVLMTLITGCMYGVNFLLISQAPVRFSRFGKVSTISGILNAATYVGCGIRARRTAVFFFPRKMGRLLEEIRRKMDQ